MLKTFHDIVHMFRDLHKDAAESKERINALQEDVYELTLLVQTLQKQIADTHSAGQVETDTNRGRND